MRIISGSLKGRKVVAPNNLPVRPTTDFAKEALFNILNNQYYFDEICALDLFAGIGSISLEFASRGVERVVGVEQHNACVKFMQQMIDKFELKNQMEIVLQDVFKYLLHKNHQTFDLVFADPPYDFTEEQYQSILNKVFENNWLNEEGQLIIEHSADYSFENHANFVDHKKYGSVNFSFFSQK